MAGWVADKSWLLIMVLQIDSENSAIGPMINQCIAIQFIINVLQCKQFP